MPPPYWIDPDQFLDLSGAVAVGRDDVRAAWEAAYALAETRLLALGAAADFYLVFGLQGAGKSTWVGRECGRRNTRSVYLCGPLPSRRHRQRAVSIAKRVGCRCIGVWIDAPFAVAAQRNALRTGLACIKEEAMLDVFSKLEPPSPEEGFDEIIIVESSGRRD